jgi:hypothetical protein
LQTLDYACYEILAIDDGSTDDTHAILLELARAIPNLRVLRNPENFGPGKTRNIGIGQAAGAYITFLDADDQLAAHALEVALNACRQKDDPELVWGNLTLVAEDGFVIMSRNRRDLFANKRAAIEGKHSYCTVAAMYQRAFLSRRGLLFEENRFYEDMLFFVRAFLEAESAAYCNACLYYYIINDKGNTGRVTSEKIGDAVYALHRMHEYLTTLDAPPGYMRSWHTAVKKFLSFLVRSRIAQAGAGAEALPAALLAHLAAYPEFAEAGYPEALPDINRRDNRLLGNSVEKIRRLAAGAVLFVAETDYHIRSMAAIARKLKALGEKVLILDVSRSPRLSVHRPLADDELDSYADVPVLPINAPAVPCVYLHIKAYVGAIDWGAFRNNYFTLQRMGVPTFALYEGICDDHNLESHRRPLPYRLAEHLLAPGDYYKSIYKPGRLHVVGAPNIQALFRQPPAKAPGQPLAVINCNFSYGVLEDKRDEFLHSAVNACVKAGIDYIVSRHPADRGDLGELPVDPRSVYACLESATLLISRFSTVILEALAMGRATVYHNPHGERFATFAEPMGAYPITTSEESLVAAIQSILAEKASPAQVRERAAPFLHRHCHVLAETPADAAAAEVIKRIVDADAPGYAKRIEALVLWAGSTDGQLRTGRAAPLAPDQLRLDALYKQQRQWKKALILLLLDRKTLKRNIAKKFGKASWPARLSRLLPN